MMGNGSNLCEEIRQRSRMRGTLIWAPPRFQIIFTLQPTHRRSDVIAAQNFLCAGCGTEIEPKYMKRLRYCDYLGKYFCECCHGGEDAVIPARVLTQWDFGRRPVCLFSKQLLDDIWNEPLFKLTSVAKGIYCQAKELQRFRELQEQLMCLKKLLITCRFAKSVLQEFEQLPSHLTQELDLFSMDDLVRVKRGQLTATARTLFYSGTMHVENCEVSVVLSTKMCADTFLYVLRRLL
uniref:Rubicon Homology domain-containing protein n=1 Tax=Denticeps clupeoides TaxID=299321 RepID=A0AAY4D4V9_9TELE